MMSLKLPLSRLPKNGLLRSQSAAQSGFTLNELLIGAALVIAVTGLSGAGMHAVLNFNQNNRAQTERRLELSRSLDFIADEVRQSESIATDASADLSSEAQAMLAAGPAPKTPILKLALPGINDQVLYYLTAAPPPWRGPNAIFRWGPAYDVNGNYQNPEDPTQWVEQPLIDLISDQVTAPNCPDRWHANPNNNAQGFFACVEDSGKLAQVNHLGIVRQILGSNTTYAMDTQVFARPIGVALGSPEVSLPSPGAPLMNAQVNITIHNLGGRITCGSGSIDPIAVFGDVLLSTGESVPLPAPGSTDVIEDVPAGTTLTITARVDPDGCDRDEDISANSNSEQGRQVLTLRDGDIVPNYQPFDQQRPIADFLETGNDENDDLPYVVGQPRRVQLAPNQVIFLFELGELFDESQPMMSQSPAFDMQDLVVVATVKAQ